MGFATKLLNPKNLRDMKDIAKISNNLEKHMKKQCAYCEDMDMGLGNEVPVVEFVKHLADKHLDKVEDKDLETYHKLIKRMT